MAVMKLKPRRLFPVSEKMCRVLRTNLHAALLNPKQLRSYLVLKPKHLNIINHPLCATWLVTWNGDEPPPISIQIFGRYFELNCQKITSRAISLEFGKETHDFPYSAVVFDDTWKGPREVGVVFLTPEECRKAAEHRALIFLNIPTPIQLFSYFLQRLIQKFWQ